MLLAYILTIFQGLPQQSLLFWGLDSLLLLLLRNRRHSCRRASHSVPDHLPRLNLNNMTM
jgi:hypothetical protein